MKPYIALTLIAVLLLAIACSAPPAKQDTVDTTVSDTTAPVTTEDTISDVTDDLDELDTLEDDLNFSELDALDEELNFG